MGSKSLKVAAELHRELKVFSSTTGESIQSLTERYITEGLRREKEGQKAKKKQRELELGKGQG